MAVDTDQNTEPTEVQIQEPEKLIRLAAMAKFMLEEARSTPCDTAGHQSPVTSQIVTSQIVPHLRSEI
jgi:hypothetical protein